MNKQHDMNRRQFLRQLGLGSASAFSLMAMSPFQAFGADIIRKTIFQANTKRKRLDSEPKTKRNGLKAANTQSV